ncbi:hypothetical protein ASG48_10380 [Aurantimonas sp. Leaf443]|nr:hypothetical protein ASG48_10380 [Aurantimonas sp. Leaf443]
MHVDLQTLYYLVIGLLCLVAGMTFRERAAFPRRARAIEAWAGGSAILAISCITIACREFLPVRLGSATSSVMSAGAYLLIAHGVALLDGRSFRRAMIAGLVAFAAGWAVWGPGNELLLWRYYGSLGVALANVALVWLLVTSEALRGQRSRSLCIAIAAIHAGFYLARVFVVPFVELAYGPQTLEITAVATLFEGCLYAVAMPMTLLSLLREEIHGQLLTATRTDFLTGLGNRLYFFEECRRLLKTEARPVALLAFDLDHFKSINDRHGHAAGDEVLKLFASVAREALGPEVTLARLGGEEFAALLFGERARAARASAQTICDRFQVASLLDGSPARATVSIGIALCEKRTRDADCLLGEADRALYRAKSLGRNRVEDNAKPAVATAA